MPVSRKEYSESLAGSEERRNIDDRIAGKENRYE